MGLSYRSEIDGDFNRKSQNFPTALYFAPPLKGFPLELGTGAGSQKIRVMGLPGLERSLTISSAVWIECTNVTDRRTDTGRQQISSLRIALRGKNGRQKNVCTCWGKRTAMKSCNSVCRKLMFYVCVCIIRSWYRCTWWTRWTAIQDSRVCSRHAYSAARSGNNTYCCYNYDSN